MKKSLTYLLLSAFGLCLSTHGNAQIAMFGNNPQHTGVYHSDLPNDLELVKKWKFKTNGMIFSSPVVSNGSIYFGSDDSCLYALDTLGHNKWIFKCDGILRSAPAVMDTLVYINTYGGTLYAINTTTGLQTWKYHTSGERHFSKIGLFGWTPADLLMNDPWDFYTSSPVVVDTLVYFGSGGTMYAINGKTGTEIWNYSTNDVIHTSPALNANSIFLGGWSGKLYALNALNGTERWIYSTGTDVTHLMQGIQASPTIADNLVVFGSRDAQVYALDISTGNKIWSTGFGGSWMPSTPAYSNGVIYCGSSEGGGLKALNKTTGSVLFTASEGFYCTFSSPAIAGETAFIGCLNGSLFAVDIRSGTIKCRFDTDGRILDPLNAILDNGTLNPDVFNPVSGYPYTQAVEYTRRLLTAGSIASTPVMANNTLYFGSSDSSLYAVYPNEWCTKEFEVSTESIELGITSQQITDTAFYVHNTGNCTDSIMIRVTNANAATVNALTIQPNRFEVMPGESIKVKIRLNTSAVTTCNSYSATLVSQSVSTVTQSKSTVFNYTTPSATGILQSNAKQTVDIYPNPFSKSLNITYSVEQDCFVDIRMYDALGQLVNIVTSQDQTSGDYQVTWNDMDNEGTKLRNGIYFCTLKKGSATVTKKIVLLNNN